MSLLPSTKPQKKLNKNYKNSPPQIPPILHRTLPLIARRATKACGARVREGIVETAASSLKLALVDSAAVGAGDGEGGGGVEGESGDGEGEVGEGGHD